MKTFCIAGPVKPEDDSAEKSWDERIFTRECTVGKYAISVWGM